MLSICKNDFFTTFTLPKNPFVIFQKPGADNAEDLIYTDKNPFLIGTSFPPAISLHLGQFPLWDANHYSAILNLYTPLCLVNWDRFHCARGHSTIRKYSDPSHYTWCLGRQSRFFLKFVDCVRLCPLVILKAIPSKTIKPGLGRLFYWNTS